MSDLKHLLTSSVGKLKLASGDSGEISLQQAIDSIISEATAILFNEYVGEHGLAGIAEVFPQGAKIKVGGLLPASHYAQYLQKIPAGWEQAFKLESTSNEATLASCIEFVLAGLYATGQISRDEQRDEQLGEQQGTVTYET